jgi:cytochrome P450
MISLQDIDEHHRRRKIWNRAFSTTAVKDYEQKLELRATELVEELAKRAGKSAKAGKMTSAIETVDLTTWFSYFA